MIGSLMTRWKSHGKRRSLVASVAVVGVLALAGCGGEADSDPEAADSAASTSSEDCMTNAETLVDEYRAASAEEEYPDEPVDGALADGLSFWVVQLYAGSPAIAAYTKGFQDAAASLGADVTVFDGKSTPAVATQGINSAIAAKADAIITILLDPETLTAPLQEAEAAGIPVINASGGDPDAELLPGLVANVTSDGDESGRIMAAAAAYDTGCETNLLIAASTSAKVSSDTAQGATDQLKELCPECHTEVVDVPLAEIASHMTQETQTTLNRNQDLNAIATTINFFDPFVEAAVKSLGKEIPIFSTTQQGDLAGADPGLVVGRAVLPPGEAYGWWYMDTVLRALDGETEQFVQIPGALIDSTNWAEDDPSSPAGSDRYSDFEGYFTQLWGQ